MVTGTTDKIEQAIDKAQEGLKNPSLPEKGLASQEGDTKPERTYTQAEVNALLGKTGQKLKADMDTVTTERNTLKSQVASLTTEITEAKADIASLSTDIEAMSADDPDKSALVKLRRDRQNELSALKQEREEIAPQKAEIAKWNRDQLVYAVADEFVTATGTQIDFDMFMSTADKFKLTEREDLVSLAETMGFSLKGEKPEETETKPPLKLNSTKGGGAFTDAQIVADFIKDPYDSAVKARYLEYLGRQK